MRTTKGSLTTRQTKTHGNVYVLHYEHNRKRVRVTLKNEAGKPITARREAERAAGKVMAPLRITDELQRKRAVANEYRDAMETARELEEANREKLTIAEAWGQYIDSPRRPDSSEATLGQYAFQFERFRKWAESQSLVHMADMEPEHGEKYARELKRAGLAASTQNKHIRLLRLVFRVLGQNAANPFKGIKSKVEEPQTRKELAWDTLCRICDQADGELKTLLFLGIYTGQRLKDCVMLQWEAVDMMRGWLLMQPAKTRRRTNGKTLQIPILPDLRNMLEAIPADRRKGYVLPELAKSYMTSRDHVTSRIQRLFKKCGVEIYEPGTGGFHKDGKWHSTGKRAVLQYGFHSLRHTTVSLLQAANVPMSVVQEIVGHRTPAMTHHYTHVGRDQIQDAMRALPSISTDTDQADQSEADRRAKLHRIIDKLPAEKLAALLKTAIKL